jgi:hypothetical protein
MSTQTNTAAAGVSSRLPAPSGQSISNSSPISSDSITLELFLKQSSISTLFERVHTDYIECLRAHTAAKDSLKALVDKCTSNGVFTRLPKSLSIDLVNKIKFPAISEQPDFFKAATDSIRDAQQKAEAAIYAALHSARQRHSDYAAQRCSQPVFIAATVANFKSVVEKYATEYKALHSAELPVDAAVLAFTRHVHDVVTRIALDDVDKQLQRAQAAANAKAADEAAQERILAGAHNGNTIRAIAQQEARQEIRHAMKQSSKFTAHQPAAATLARSPTDGRSIQTSAKSRNNRSHHNNTVTTHHTARSHSQSSPFTASDTSMPPSSRKRKAAVMFSDASESPQQRSSTTELPARSLTELQPQQQQQQHTQKQHSTNAKGGSARRNASSPAHKRPRHSQQHGKVRASAASSESDNAQASTAMQQ